MKRKNAVRALALLLGISSAVFSAETPEKAAEATFRAHGGEKFAALSSISVTGTVDVTASSFQQAIPATFATVLSGELYLLEVNAAFVSFRQSFDGENTYTTPERGFSLPPLNRIGIALLQKLGEKDFVVSESGKQGGFRITSPEGYYTDFYIDKKTSLVKSYDAAYVVGGRDVTTKVEIKDYELLDGVRLPARYDQRFDLAGMTVYAAFKSKEIVINKEVPAGFFGPVGLGTGK